MKVRVKENEVIWVIGSRVNKGAQANYMLRSQLGESASSFVPMDVGAGFYTWELPGEGWVRLSQVAPADAARARHALTALKENVARGVNNEPLVEALFTVPNDDFIFCRNDAGGKIELGITAWGFRNYNKPVGGPITKELGNSKMQRVAVGFRIDGSPAPRRAFTSCLPYQQLPARLVTMENGLHRFEQKLKVGEQIDIVDCESGGHFALVVTGGVEEYWFDVTEFSNVTVSVFENGLPKENAVVYLNCNGREVAALTDAAGNALLKTVYSKDALAAVSVGDERKEVLLEKDGNRILFEFFPQPEYENTLISMRVKVLVTEGGEPVANESVKIEFNGGADFVFTDDEGMARHELWNAQGKDIIAAVREVEQCCKSDSFEVFFEFKFEKPEKPKVKIVVHRDKYTPLQDTGITLTQGNTVMEMLLDGQGNAFFERDGFERGKEIVAGFKVGNERFDVPFTMEENEDEYLLEAEIMKRNKWLKVAEITAYMLLAVSTIVAAPYFVGAAKGVADAIMKSI